MTFTEFKRSTSHREPPASASAYLLALWFDAVGDWNKAHQIIQDLDDKQAAWIHAYLHRKEGDMGNADYWYHRAQKERPRESLDIEWENIVNALL